MPSRKVAGSAAAAFPPSEETSEETRLPQASEPSPDLISLRETLRDMFDAIKDIRTDLSDVKSRLSASETRHSELQRDVAALTSNASQLTPPLARGLAPANLESTQPTSAPEDLPTGIRASLPQRPLLASTVHDPIGTGVNGDGTFPGFPPAVPSQRSYPVSQTTPTSDSTTYGRHLELDMAGPGPGPQYLLTRQRRTFLVCSKRSIKSS